MEAISGSGNISSRKEKRPYKKRKHKLPREKQQPQPQQQYLPGIGLIAPAPGVSTAHLTNLHHLQRQSASPAANESNLDGEDEDYVNGSAHNGNKMGSESKDEAPFAFRRKTSCNYLRTRNQNGQWPWEFPDKAYLQLLRLWLWLWLWIQRHTRDAIRSSRNNIN